MKYILILIMSFAFGQVPKPLAGIEGIWSIVNGDSTFIFNGDTGENPNYAKRMWRNFYNKTPITMGMVLEYAEECYNDSTEDYYHLTDAFPCVSYMTDYGSCYNAGHRDSIYFRHPTPTFPGFIEWFGR